VIGHVVPETIQRERSRTAARAPAESRPSFLKRVREIWTRPWRRWPR
jgi:hypothetical protein